MQQTKISILSTRPIDSALIKEARLLNIKIDVLSFIETEPIRSIEVQQEIENALLKSSAVVFTSMNAVEAVANELDGQQPDWRIYSIGNTTRQLVKKYFGEEAIAGTAESAAELADLIVVQSFFSNNKISDKTMLFDIGNTTATEIKKYTNNKIITGDEPSKENLVMEMIRYYT